MMRRFQDRTEAGRALGRALRPYRSRENLIVLGLPRGGVPVAYEVARELGAPLDVCVVRKLGVPGHRELAMGAIASGDVCVFNPEVVHAAGVSREEIQEVIEEEKQELMRREEAYRGDRPALDVAGAVVILVDDGLATGATMRAAVRAMRELRAKQVVVGIPVAPASSCRTLTHEADDVVCLLRPEYFESVGQWYDDFEQLTDEDVRHALAQAHATEDAAPHAPPRQSA
jgi:predicted phosphoribosyltransferase